MRFRARLRRLLVTDAANEAQLKSIVAQYAEDVRTDLGAFDPDLQITVEKAERPRR